MGKVIQDAFSVTLLAHLLGATSLVCILGYQILTSEKVCDAFYSCEWYCMSTNNAKIIMICMERSQKPLRLTAGKFGLFCLATLTNVLKTSMAYLSVLRNFL